MDEDVFATGFLLDEAEALLAIEELHRTLAGAHDLGGHAVETAATAAAATVAAAEAAASAAATAATEAVTAATEAIAAAAIVAERIVWSKVRRRAAERIEAILPKTIALIPSATAPFIVTHNPNSTFVQPVFLNPRRVGCLATPDRGGCARRAAHRTFRHA